MRNRRNRTFIVFLLLTCQNFSCNSNRQPEKSATSEIKEVQIDTNAVLTYSDNKCISRDSSMSMLIKALGLNKINGSQEEIRIWLNYALTDTGTIVIIKKENEKWHSSVFFYKAKVDTVGNIIAVEKTQEENERISGWLSFLKNLKNLGIYNLKNFIEISGYHECMDGNHLAIEVWKNKRYRIYDYPCFDQYFDKLYEIKRLREFIILMQKEFRYKLL
jgi:hypothetical protein